MKIAKIKGYENLYEVSEYGNIYALPKIVFSGKNGNIVKHYERVEKNQRIDKYGYSRVGLCKDGKVKTFTIHRLVAIAFCEGDSNLTVNHKDGNKKNNHYSNLEFISSSENLKHAHRTGLSKSPIVKVGTENKRAKLNEKQVINIRKSFLSLRKLAEIYGVHHSVINGIKNGTRYFNVKE